METEKAKGSALLASEHDLVELWLLEPSLREDGGPMYHALSAASLLTSKAGEEDKSAEEAARVYSAALGFLIALFHAERVFLFDTSSREGEEAAVGEPLATRDLDGEPVSQPERKAPSDVLLEALKTRQPVLCPAGAGGGEAWQGEPAADREARALALPVESGGRIEGVIYIENRFQPLELSRESLRLARAYATVIGSLAELGRIRKENESLWMDITRLREEKPRESLSTPAVHHRDPPRGTKRSDLKGDYASTVGSSPKMLEIFRVLDRISGSNAPVLIDGESGTGKELIARAVHENSLRRGKVFVSENCGALTETLLESELFGYVKGAFTGANKDHKGLFELAIGGTLFLDEVGDMSPGMQKKLLRVLQEGVIRRVGGKEYIPVDTRIISATNKDLLSEVRAGNFREDLYYRLNVINLKLPPLRERKEDIPELVEHFLSDLERETGIKKRIDPAAVARLVQHAWPGNIRELRNEVKRLHALSDGDIRIQDLSETLLAGDGMDLPFQELERLLPRLTLREATERMEKEMIRNALVQCRGNKSLMAKMLQVPKTSLYNKINKYGLDRV